MPPGPDFRCKQTQRFNSIIRKYAPVILGIYGGHYHFDAFRIYFDEEGVLQLP
jgi:hypothetical protein